ncbi:motile sperm domain-containing protein 1-like isoform X1 [Paramormyrops kingsleyae]|uniref:motile sperm domain-containing protein 1-like isoform X1 n=1 Tax=Paramormyrops kingsleyae TaxID=1676925 RepID=UPI003B974C0E
MKNQDQSSWVRTQDKGSTRSRDRDAPKSPAALVGPTGPRDSLPVFLFPTELLFFSQQSSSHRRVLTFYNPYSFPLRFKMLCTAPSLYTVVDAEGSVRARSCVDIVVRHQDVSSRNWGRRDRFRLEVWGGGQGGSREIWAELRGGQEGDRSQGTHQRRAASPRRSVPALPEGYWNHDGGRNASLFALYVVISLVCLAFLMLPLHNESSTLVPTVMHVTVMQKLVCAYVLGLLTMVFLR